MGKWKTKGVLTKSLTLGNQDDWQAVSKEKKHTKGKWILFTIPFIIIGLLNYSFSIIDNLRVKPNDISHAKEISNYYHMMKKKGYQFNDHQEQIYSYYEAFFDKNGNYEFLNYPHAVIFYGSKAHRESYISAVILSSTFLLLAFCLSILLLKLIPFRKNRKKHLH